MTPRSLSKAALAVLAVLFAACGGAPVKATVEADADPTFYGVCYGLDGRPVSYESECGAGELVVWKLPIPVAIDDKYPDPGVVRAALAWWNEQLGGEVFREVPLDESRVLVKADDALVPGDLAGFMHIMRDPRYGFYALAAMKAKYADDSVVIRHELGHVLGLAHDTASKSIMRSGGAPDARALMAEDRAALRAVYNLK